MNKANNKRKQETITKIENAFLNLLQNQNINKITVTDICEKTKLNRSTFYANFIDTYELSDKLALKIESKIKKIYQEEKHTFENALLNFFIHIKNNKEIYKTFYNLGNDKLIDIYNLDKKLTKRYHNDFLTDYHKTFYNAGINGIIKKWVKEECSETPQEIYEVIKNEYKLKEI